MTVEEKRRGRRREKRWREGGMGRGEEAWERNDVEEGGRRRRKKGGKGGKRR